MIKIGVLAFHGDVSEHIETTKRAAANLNLAEKITVVEVRTKTDLLNGLDALIIPGGESTVMHKLAERDGFFEEMKKIKNIFGTCAGAIMLAKTVYNKEEGQKTLELMDVEIDRNAYGAQLDSFEHELFVTLDKPEKINGIFIRAPKITKINAGVNVLATLKDAHETYVVGCEQRVGDNYYLALSFHPELELNTKFHEYFLLAVAKTIQKRSICVNL